jgi:hypothetical protein
MKLRIITKPLEVNTLPFNIYRYGKCTQCTAQQFLDCGSHLLVLKTVKLTEDVYRA